MRPIKSNIEVLSEKELRLLHDAALKILSEIGMKVPNEELLNACRERGCIVKGEDTLLFPVTIMEDFIEKSRAQDVSVPAGTPQKLYGRISSQVTLVDPMKKTRRYGLREDNIKGYRLMEQLANVPAAGPVVIPSDVPPAIADTVAFADMYKYSTKPGLGYVLTMTGAKYMQQIYDLMELKSNYLLESISPLSFKPDTLEIALYFAQRGGELRIAPMAMGAATAPVTVSGTLALETAEALGSGFLVHAMTGGFPAFEASCHSADLRTMLCSFGSPNQAFFAAAAAQLARYYGMKGGSNAALTDAILPDFQGGFEKGVSAAFAGLSGMSFIGCQGIAGADQGFSFEQLVIDNEWLDYLNHLISGFDVTEESIGYEAIKEVGIAGNFLGEEHTFAHMRDDYWHSQLFTRRSWEAWKDSSWESLLDRAHAFVERATAGYQNAESVLDDNTRRALDQIIGEAYQGEAQC